MIIPHEPWLVALSIAIAIQGSFVGLSLARGLDSAEGFRRRLALAGSAITLATGVWSMHFVAMLAANFPSAVDYLVLPTLISFLICVIVVGVGAYAAHMPGSPTFRIGTGALAMGLGVSLMHYVGMSAVHLAAPTSYVPSYVVASIAVSIAASAFALWTIDRRPTRPRLFLGAIALGLAISGMHYTTFRVSSARSRRCRATRLRCSPRSLRSACPAPFFFRSCRMRGHLETPKVLRRKCSGSRRRLPQ
jgi:diguanylate cyclase